MKLVGAVLLLLTGLVPGAASAMPTPPLPPVPITPIQGPVPITDTIPNRGITVSLSTDRAGARPVTVTLQLTYQMRCGHPGRGSLIVSFPAAERLPARIPAAAVSLDGHSAPAVSRHGKDVTIALPRPHGISCNIIAPGKVTVVFTTAARLGNPNNAGSYPLSARIRNLLLQTTLQIRPA